MSVRIFLSAVSDEFQDYREQLRHDLTRQNVEVKIQEDFKDLGTATLGKLNTYIKACDAVVHLVGEMTGAMAKDASTTAILEKNRGLGDKLPPLRELIQNRINISYTQWEAWLALYHNKLLLIAKAHSSAPRGPHYKPTTASRVAQRAHLERLSKVERYPGDPFTSPDNLAKNILSSVILDLLVGSSVRRELNATMEKGNKTKLKKLQTNLRSIEAVMINVNGMKKNSIQMFNDYLTNKKFDTWATIQTSCAGISKSLNKLRSDIAEKQPQVAGSVGFVKAGDLQAALEYQEKIYKYLSKSPEPAGAPARAELKTTVNKLAALYKQVLTLELIIETYLHPAPASPQTPRENLSN
jgi:hypothetical protein